MAIETCWNCHSFYTGVQTISKAGAADRYFKKQAKAEELATIQRKTREEKKREKDKKRKEKLAKTVGIDIGALMGNKHGISGEYAKEESTDSEK